MLKTVGIGKFNTWVTVNISMAIHTFLLVLSTKISAMEAAANKKRNADCV
jgi:hypothetical protein